MDLDNLTSYNSTIMNNTITISIIIPTLNEAECLPFVLSSIPNYVDEILVVDGNSTDRTQEIAKKWHHKVNVIQQEGKGKGGAIRTGVLKAKGDIIILLDGDGSTSPREIPLFVGALLSGADYAKGSRFLSGAGTDDMPFYKKVGNTALTVLTNILFGTRYSDITYGYNAFWRRHAPYLALEIDDWSSEIITNIRASRNGLRVVEVSCIEYLRIAGDAKLEAFSAGWTILKAILAERFRNRKVFSDIDNEKGIITQECDYFVSTSQLLITEAKALVSYKQSMPPHQYKTAVDILIQALEELPKHHVDDPVSYKFLKGYADQTKSALLHYLSV